MCFVQDDADWTATRCDEADTTAAKETRCDECGATIPAGAFVHTVHLEETDWCVDCENGDCECVGECCQCPKPNYGETFDYERCESCDKFLRAVKSAEIAAGCAEHEALPGFGGMIEDIGCSNGSQDEAKRYFKAARRMFPELVTSGYLGRMWRTMF